MAISFVGANSNNSGGGSTSNPNVQLHANTQTGDLGIIALGLNTNNAYTTPSGWTLDSNTPINWGASMQLLIYRKILDSSEASTTVTVSGGGAEWGIGSIVLRGTDGTTGTNAFTFDTLHASVSSSHTNPAITPTVNDCILVGCAHFRYAATGGSHTPHADFTERMDTTGGDTASPAHGLTIFTRLLTGQANVQQGSWTSTTSQDARHSIAMMAIAPSTGTFPDVIVGGVKKTVTSWSVIVGGQKKTISSASVIVGGVKKTIT